MYVFCSGEGDWCAFGWKNGEKRRKEVGKELLVWEDSDGANDEGLILVKDEISFSDLFIWGDCW